MVNRKTQKGGFNNLGIVLVLLVLLVVFAFIVALQKTSWFNNAAGIQQIPESAITNLNSSNEIVAPNNPDGTMGPPTWYGNYSNALSASQKGNLSFKVIDPPQGEGKPDNPKSRGNRPTVIISVTPTPTLSVPVTSSITPSASPVVKNGPQNPTALYLTIRKVEVHMAYLGNPGNKQDVRVTPGEKIKPTNSQTGEEGKNVNHWETLNVTTPFTVDLVDLAKTKNFAQLGITQLAEGRYTEIRLYVESASATLSDGTVVPLTTLGRDNIVRVVRPFTIVSGETTELTMDIDAKHSIIKTGGQYLLKPVVSRLIVGKSSK